MSVLHESSKGIVAIFVTMNRRDIAEVCLKKLAAQTLLPGQVIVVNNASTDGTSDFLKTTSDDTGGWITVIELEQNLGNAGGMEIAIKKAFSQNFEAVWILDDDSWPEPEALEQLMAPHLPNDVVRSCRVMDTESNTLSWPLQVLDHDGWRLVEGRDSLPFGDVIRIRRSWLGSLIPRMVYDRVGPVEGRLFLRGEDEDYPRRIELAGFSVFMMVDSILHHPPAGILNRLRVGNKTLVLEKGLSGDKLYYRLRNIFWMAIRDQGKIRALLVTILFGFALYRWEKFSLNWFSVWWEATCDAFRDRLGARRSFPYQN
jgi:rhamnopyranosyl-N-acetylglucosaminyl-diphospho-decaprenol beta-1,3/1,4-galactofuranosyltransferase